MNKPKPIDGKCAKCGSESMTLAEDNTLYSLCEVVDGRWVCKPDNTEPTGMDESIRFFCADCGEYHEVPEELG